MSSAPEAASNFGWAINEHLEVVFQMQTAAGKKIEVAR
jgi:hypothetical protein